MTTPHPTKSAPAPSVTYTELPDFHNLIRDAIDAAKEKKNGA